MDDAVAEEEPPEGSQERVSDSAHAEEARQLRAVVKEQAHRLQRMTEALTAIMEQGYKYQHRTQHLKAVALLAQDALGIEEKVNGVEYVPGDWKKCHRCGDAVADVTTLEGALRAIRGPADSGPWIAAYRDAGGGYEGLQAIAETALAAVERGR